MGRRGPQKKLAAIKALEGNPGKQVIEETGMSSNERGRQLRRPAN
jgi:hypothetical protein